MIQPHAKAEQYRELSQFFGCYFHQDWPEEYVNHDEAVQAFLEQTSEELIHSVSKELLELSVDPWFIENPEDALVRLGCFFSPPVDQNSAHWVRELYHEYFAQR